MIMAIKDIPGKRLSREEAEEARERCLDYIESMRLEGMALDDEQHSVLMALCDERIPADQAVEYIMTLLREKDEKG